MDVTVVDPMDNDIPIKVLERSYTVHLFMLDGLISNMLVTKKAIETKGGTKHEDILAAFDMIDKIAEIILHTKNELSLKLGSDEQPNMN